MASEARRGCGFRKVGGIYLVGGAISEPCDRLPFPLDVCPVCGHGVKLGRGMTSVNPLKLFGKHHNCVDKNRPCIVCDPTEVTAYIMRVGEKFYPTPEHFLEEGRALGISKRISQIPLKFKLGKTVVYLAHINAYVVKEFPTIQQTFIQEEVAPRMLEVEKQKRVMGIFSAFIPQRIEKIYWQSALDGMPKKERAKLKRIGITPIGVADNDPDHR
jgi:hypothetical protein